MTWVRTDDSFTDWSVFDALSYPARWHYLALIHACARTHRYDGVLRAVDARRASDVPDAEAVAAELIAAGLVAWVKGGLRLVQIDKHLPPPHLRDEQRKAAQAERKRRQRAHQAGDHALCPPESACVTRSVPRDVTRDTGTGRDGPGRDQAVGENSVTQSVTGDGSKVCKWCTGDPAPDGCPDCGAGPPPHLSAVPARHVDDRERYRS